MDSTQLERDALEGKDRDELTTIATALGGKPGSRARKAEIVDLILDLAGFETSSNGSSPSNDAAPVQEPSAEEVAE
jgi:transcription termination factor Rho